jgi:tRNA A-37 threonylcarbamoyl transferase component Bud32
MDADRNLLFGLLALQNGLVDQDQLVGAFRAWTRDKARPLADHLAARGDLDPDQRAAVEALVVLHVKKHGDAERSLAALRVGGSTRATLAKVGDSDVEASLAHVRPGSTEPDETRSGATMTLSVGTTTSHGQRFRVLRPHARGGLGAVFVALDNELHREVALKQILEHHADDPASRARFLTEAEITGGLEHPGIVPVYGLGTYGDGRPYYAMRFVEGDSLKEAIAAYHAARPRPDPAGVEFRKLLGRFVDVCEAIAYAHSKGVLHRDLKPHNVMLGRYGETLLIDWGLAKATGRRAPSGPADSGEATLVPSSGGSHEPTLGVIGTPAFMSPEQASGRADALGPATDVYGLGATLYALLTGVPPVDGGSSEEVLGRTSPRRWRRSA